LRPIQVLLLLVAFLLLIACTNVAVMLLSRNATRRTEIAIRLAIGAGSRRLMQQLLTEALLLAGLGAGVALALTPWATRALVALLPSHSGETSVHVGIDARVWLFTAGVSIAAALLVASVPALRATRLDGAGLQVGHQRGALPSSGRIGSLLVAAQVAMSLVVLTSAGLLVRTLYDLTTFNPGFDTDRVILLDVTPASRGYVDEKRNSYYRDLLERLASTPGVQSATLSQIGFLDRDNRTTGTINVNGGTQLSDDERQVHVYLVGPRFFETLAIPVVNGRDFIPADMAGPRVAALNATAARRFFGSQNPIGSVINGGVRVLAVVGDSRYHELREQPAPAMFLPYTQSRIRERMVFSVRGSHDGMAAALMREAAALDPLVPMRVAALSEIRARSLLQERLLAVLSGFFAVAALGLLAVGLYALVTFHVRQRTSEIGVRVALGAQTSQVVWLVLRQPLRLALAGISVGLPATVAVTRLMTALLYGVTPGDGRTLVIATFGVLLIVTGAAVWPAWRVSRLDPAIALRRE
jgi:predicted permease